MPTVNMHEAKTHLSKLVNAASDGEVVIIAKAGKPVAKLTRIDSPTARRRLGFLAGDAQVPDDFDEIAGADIAALFEGEDA
ncbi:MULTISPECIES: type II toxin-antitoxin system Phd/YefM family antitoxin [Microbacterium]|uniref:Antitoxin n=1 Tax=Microbacterium profundi TaxID=450380 RepID=A0ABV3LF42_9MICO|nr:type II toxin-antitoxin system prevent-host-death family antitoxin [Microbacterium profundi]MCE7481881.1 type II toxin-antitoxin system prevent-host-death family antitoxin [Microbacterium profundi]